MRFVKGSKPMPPPWCNMTEQDPDYADYTATIPGGYGFTSEPRSPSTWEMLYKSYLEQKRRALITELRALDKLLGRRQTIPRKER